MKKKLYILIIVLISFSGLHGQFNRSTSFGVITEGTSENNELKTANDWDLTNKILIDNNWSDTRDTYDWCSGSGTLVDPFVIENVTINGQNSGICIIVQNTNDYFIINNCTFYNSNTGMRLINVNYGTINNCSVFDNDDNGIYLDQCSNNTILNCSVYENSDYGILFDEDCYSNLVEDNIFKDNLYGGLRLYQYCDYNLIFNNTFIDDNLFLVYHHDWNRIEDNILIGGSIVLYDWCFNNTISSNYLTGTSVKSKIYLQGSGNTIQDNIIRYGVGIEIWGSYYNKFINNTVVYSERGIDIGRHSDYNTIINNTFGENERGISCGGDNNIIIRNLVKNNAIGISISFSDNNLIYLNIFDNNEYRNAEDNGGVNKWDNGSIGNYWHDYDGIDDDDNGIGDTPYNITDNSGNPGPDLQDRYPIWYTEPTIIVNSPSNNSYWNSEPLLNVVATDATLNYTWYNVSIHREFLESGIGENLRTDIWDSLLDGTFVIEFFANDSIGNINDKFKHTITKDTIAPLLQVISPLESTIFTSGPMGFELSITEPNIDLVWYTINNQETRYYFEGLNGTVDSTAWNSLPNGNVNITFGVSDKAGNITFKSITVKKQYLEIPSYNLLVVLSILLGTIAFLSLIRIKKLNKY